MTTERNPGGRPRIDADQPLTRMPISFTQQQVDRLKRRAELAGVSAAELVRRYVTAGLDMTAPLGEDIRRRIEQGQEVRLTNMRRDFVAHYQVPNHNWICHEETVKGRIVGRPWLADDALLAAEAEERTAAGWIIG